MSSVVTAERALAEGSTPEHIEMVADWHEGVVNDIRFDLKSNKKKTRHGGKASIPRHETIARELRLVASEMRRLTEKAAA